MFDFRGIFQLWEPPLFSEKLEKKEFFTAKFSSLLLNDVAQSGKGKLLGVAPKSFQLPIEPQNGSKTTWNS
jgi:hypothetical protein